MNGEDALVFFFAVFWGATLGTISKYRVFDGHRLREPEIRSFVAKRVAIGFVTVNVLPVAMFLVLYSYIVSDRDSSLGAATGVVAALSIFGVVRLLHSVIAADETRKAFYLEDEWSEIAPSLARGDNRSMSHLMPGLVFLFAFPGIAFLLKFLAER